MQVLYIVSLFVLLTLILLSTNPLLPPRGELRNRERESGSDWACNSDNIGWRRVIIFIHPRTEEGRGRWQLINNTIGLFKVLFFNKKICLGRKLSLLFSSRPGRPLSLAFCERKMESRKFKNVNFYFSRIAQGRIKGGDGRGRAEGLMFWECALKWVIADSPPLNSYYNRKGKCVGGKCAHILPPRPRVYDVCRCVPYVETYTYLCLL